MNTSVRSDLELTRLMRLKCELEEQLAALNDKLETMTRSDSSTAEKPFMRLAGSIEGATDLSTRRGFAAT